MTALLLVVVCCATTAVAVRRPLWWMGTGLVIAVLPVAATRSWLAALGPVAAVPPATWVFLAGSIALLLRAERVVHPWTRNLLLAVVAVASGSTLLTFLAHGASSATPLLTIWVLPLSGFVAVVALTTTNTDIDITAALRPVLFCLAAAESLLALAQRTVGSALLFDEFRSAAAQFARTNRSTGTFDTPLDLAAFLTLVLAVTVRDERPWRMWSTSALGLVGVLCTGSRTGIVLAFATLALGLAARGTRRIVDVGVALAATVGLALLVSSRWAQPFFDRFGDRGDTSTWARDLARDAGLQLVQARPWQGSGLGFSYDWAQANLPSSFENAWLTLAVGAGVPVTLLLLALPVVGWLVPGRLSILVRAAGVVPLVWGFSYSSYTATSTFGVLAWTFLGLCTVTLLRERATKNEQQPAAGRPLERRRVA